MTVAQNIDQLAADNGWTRGQHAFPNGRISPTIDFRRGDVLVQATFEAGRLTDVRRIQTPRVLQVAPHPGQRKVLESWLKADASVALFVDSDERVIFAEPIKATDHHAATTRVLDGWIVDHPVDGSWVLVQLADLEIVKVESVLLAAYPVQRDDEPGVGFYYRRMDAELDAEKRLHALSGSGPFSSITFID